MKIYGIIGWKNAGKTTLVERLVAEISRRGLTVSTIKHSHHAIDLDADGSDSARHRAAGAIEVALATPQQFFLMRNEGLDLEAIMARLAAVDLVLVEGFKYASHPKIEVFRRETGHSLLQPQDAMVRALASDGAVPDATVPVLNLNDTLQIADFILKDLGLDSV